MKITPEFNLMSSSSTVLISGLHWRQCCSCPLKRHSGKPVGQKNFNPSTICSIFCTDELKLAYLAYYDFKISATCFSSNPSIEGTINSHENRCVLPHAVLLAFSFPREMHFEGYYKKTWNQQLHLKSQCQSVKNDRPCVRTNIMQD